jgi:type IV secretory pathway VirJ component
MGKVRGTSGGKLACAAALALFVPATAFAESFSYGRFGAVTVYRPDAPPSAVAIFLSGDGGWNQGVVSMAKTIAGNGAVVLGVNFVQFNKALDAMTNTSCNDAGSDLEALAAQASRELSLPNNLPVVLIGYSSGATAVYLAQAQAAQGAFAGSVALGFCPDLASKKPYCPGRSREMVPVKGGEGRLYPAVTVGMSGFIALQGMQDQVCPPQATIDFIGKVPGAQIVTMAKVGHGFGVERNWMPQFVTAFRTILAQAKAKS